MDKLEIIKQVENKLSKDMLSGTLSYKGEIIPFSTFLEQHLINAIIGDDIDEIVNFIEATFKSRITYPEFSRDDKALYVDNFLNNNALAVSDVRVSNDVYVDIRDFLLKNIQDDYTILIGPNKKSIEEAYMVAINNFYQEPNINDKIELCEYLASYLDPVILESKMPDMDITVYRYIVEVLPKKMVDALNIEIDGKKVGVDELVTKIANHQRKLLEEEREKEIREKEEIFNRTGEHPNLINEIEIATSNDRLEITSKLPIVTSSLLTEGETNAFLEIQEENIAELSNDDYYIRMFNNIKDRIRTVKTADGLRNIENQFVELFNDYKKYNISETILSLIESISEDIEIKRTNLIKIENNLEVAVDASLGQINQMKSSFGSSSISSTFDVVDGELVSMIKVINDWSLKDAHLRGQVDLFKNDLIKKRLMADAIRPNEDKVISRAKSDIDITLISAINQRKSLKYNDNPIFQAAAMVAINSYIDEAKKKIEAAYEEKKISKEEKEQYLQTIYSVMEDKELKSGYGK